MVQCWRDYFACGGSLRWEGLDVKSRKAGAKRLRKYCVRDTRLPLARVLSCDAETRDSTLLWVVAPCLSASTRREKLAGKYLFFGLPTRAQRKIGCVSLRRSLNSSLNALSYRLWDPMGPGLLRSRRDCLDNSESRQMRGAFLLFPPEKGSHFYPLAHLSFLFARSEQP